MNDDWDDLGHSLPSIYRDSGIQYIEGVAWVSNCLTFPIVRVYKVGQGSLYLLSVEASLSRHRPIRRVTIAAFEIFSFLTNILTSSTYRPIYIIHRHLKVYTFKGPHPIHNGSMPIHSMMSIRPLMFTQRCTSIGAVHSRVDRWDVFVGVFKSRDVRRSVAYC